MTLKFERWRIASSLTPLTPPGDRRQVRVLRLRAKCVPLVLAVQSAVALYAPTKIGAIRIHGHLSNRCAGSGVSLCSQGSLSSIRSPEDSETPPVAQYSSSELLFSSKLRQSTPVLKRIPRAARHLAATKLASVLDDVSEKNEIAPHGLVCLAQPRRGGQRRSLTSVVKRQLEDEADPSFHVIAVCPA